MEVEVDLEEQACLAQDVEEAVERKMREEKEKGGMVEEENGGTDWVDHSALESEESSD